MRLLCCLAAVATGLVLTGCGGKSDKTATTAATNGAASGSSPLTAPVDYLGAVAKGQQTAVKTIDTASLDKAIQLFNVDNGRNPKDLNELVEQKYIGKIPAAPYGMKLVYDPNAGKVSVVKQ